MKSFLYSLKKTAQCFFFLPAKTPDHAPYIQDPIDIKRIMTLVVLALMPCTFFAILQSGMLATLYETINIDLFKDYLQAQKDFSSLLFFQIEHFSTFFMKGLWLFVPQLLIIYLVGGIIEIYFASLHKKTVSEGFFVTGILFALTIPPTLPYWMTIFGVTFGLILGKELFGGTGMNIFNPALVCRCILYFSFPSYMTGSIWVGDRTFTTLSNVATYNQKLQTESYDSITTATPLNISEQASKFTKLQIDAAALFFTKDIAQKNLIEQKLHEFNPELSINTLSKKDLITFSSHLGIVENNISEAVNFAKLLYNKTPYNNLNLFYGNMGGSFGEVSKFGSILGLLFLLLVRLISIPIITSVLISALVVAQAFAFFASPESASAYFFLPAYKHLLIGGFLFGAVFMATEPVTAPATRRAQIAYGTLIGSLTIFIRIINPAFPEGIMLAILFANSFSPLLDRIFLSFKRKIFTGKITKDKEIVV